MLLPKRGFYHPVAILILAGITFSIAIVFYLNSNVLFKPKPTPAPSAAESPQISPEPSPTQEPIVWKTYKNSNLGFSINYPDNFTVTETAEKISFARGIREFTVRVAPTELKNIQEVGDQFNSGINKVGEREFYVSYDDVANDNVGNTYTQINNGKQYQIYFAANLPEVDIIKSLKFLD